MQRLLKNLSCIYCACISFSFFTVTAYAQDAPPSSLVSEYLALLEQHMKIKGLVPLYDRGVNYRVGDLWDPSMTRLLEAADRCFPKLMMRSARDSIPQLHYSRVEAVGFLIGVRHFFDAQASSDISHTVTVTFEDVVEEVASEGDLRQFYSIQNCPEAQAIVQGGRYDNHNLLAVVVGRLYVGKRHISIVYADDAAAKAHVDEIRALAGRAAVSVGVSASLEGGNSISIIDNDAVPLGYTPAFVPVVIAGASQGEGQQEPEYGWRPFDPVETPSQAAILDDLAASGQSKWQWNDH